MSVRMRHTSSHTRNRRSHHALKAQTLVKDTESGALRMPHRLDESTGMYRGKQIRPIKAVRAEKKDAARKEKSKREHAHEQAEGAKEPIHSEKETKKTGVMGRMTKGKAKARSGMGGGA